MDIKSTFQFTSVEDKYNIDNVMEQFDAYCLPRKNLAILRNKFLTSKQSSGQKFNKFVTVLCQRATDCELGDLMDTLVKDVFIIGTNDLSLRECLLRDHNFTLGQAIQAGQAAEETRSQARILASTETYEADVAAIRQRHKKKEISSDLNSSNIFPGIITTYDLEPEVQPFHNQATTALPINTLHYNEQANPWTELGHQQHKIST